MIKGSDQFQAAKLQHINYFQMSLKVYFFLSKIINNFPGPITTSCPTPALDHLFAVHNKSEAKFLPEAQSNAFHHMVVQLLILCKHTRRDIEPAVSFLRTRVKRPDKDNWGKLNQVLQYLHRTKHMKLNLSADNITCIK